MKNNGLSLMIALLLGGLRTNSVFAAPGPGQNRDLEQEWANRSLRQLENHLSMMRGLRMKLDAIPTKR